MSGQKNTPKIYFIQRGTLKLSFSKLKMDYMKKPLILFCGSNTIDTCSATPAVC